MNAPLLSYYEAIEKVSIDMLDAAQAGNWDQVVRLEGACILLINQLKNTARNQELSSEETSAKTLIMGRILKRDAEIRALAEPWLEEQERRMLTQGTSILH